jgi:hypothetical protein
LFVHAFVYSVIEETLILTDAIPLDRILSFPVFVDRQSRRNYRRKFLPDRVVFFPPIAISQVEPDVMAFLK